MMQFAPAYVASAQICPWNIEMNNEPGQLVMAFSAPILEK